MKMQWLWFGLVVLSSCSASRYTYYFDHQVSNRRTERLSTSHDAIPPPVLVKFTASTARGLETPPQSTLAKGSVQRQTDWREPQHRSMLAKDEIAKLSLPPATSKPKGMDRDLRRSIIFVAAGIVFLLIGTQAFWVLGTLSVLLGLIFGIKWILRR